MNCWHLKKNFLEVGRVELFVGQHNFLHKVSVLAYVNVSYKKFSDKIGAWQRFGK